MEKNFDDIYNEIYFKYNKYNKETSAIQKNRKKTIRIIFFICLAIRCVLLVLLALSKYRVYIIYFVIECVAFFVFFIKITSIINTLINTFDKKGRHSYKVGVIADLIHAVYPNSEYDYTKGISRNDYNKKAFIDIFSIFNSEDLVITHNNINLTFSEVHTKTESTDSDGNTIYQTSFLGIAGFCDLVKPLNTNLYITSNRFFAKHDKDNVRVDMPEFEKTFDVFATNKITAMGLLTADVMAELLDIKNGLGNMFELAIENNKIYFRMHTGDSFETSMFKNNLDVDKIKKYYDILCHVDRITQMINNHINELEI